MSVPWSIINLDISIRGTNETQFAPSVVISEELIALNQLTMTASNSRYSTCNDRMDKTLTSPNFHCFITGDTCHCRGSVSRNRFEYTAYWNANQFSIILNLITMDIRSYAYGLIRKGIPIFQKKLFSLR